MDMRKNSWATLLAITLASIPAFANAGPFEKIYTVGDSLSDQGNLYFATADAVDPAPIPYPGLPRSDFYTDGVLIGRFTNGANWIDVLAADLGAESEPSYYLGGTNFAYGGTRTDYNTVELDWTKPEEVQFLTWSVPQGNTFPENLYPWTLNKQVEAFAEDDNSDPDGLYVVFSGSNDLADIILMSVLPDPSDPMSPILTNTEAYARLINVVSGASNAIDKMIDAGAQDILVPNLPNLGVVPGFTDLAPVAEFWSAEYNTLLDQMLLTKTDVNIIRFDTFTLTSEVAENPAAFGFTNATQPCYTGFVAEVPGEEVFICEDPDAYVFFDREHPTAAFHALLAETIGYEMLSDLLNYLTSQVEQLTGGTQKSLEKKLMGAIAKLEDGNSANDQAAIGKLQAFINSVEAKQGKKIPQDLATSMILRAEKIIALLEAGY